MERRFDAGRLDKGQLRLPVAPRKSGIGLRLRLREDPEKSEMRASCCKRHGRRLQAGFRPVK